MTITIRERVYEQLRDEAREERRPVREQAAYLLERQLLRNECSKSDRQPAKVAS